MSGVDQAIKDFVLREPKAVEYITKIHNMVEFVIPLCITEGKSQLVIALGCTGGRHRSVVLAESLRDKLVEARHRVVVEHRHISSEGV